MGAHVISLQPFDKSRIAAWGSKWRQQHSRDRAKSFYPENLVQQDGRRGQKATPLEHLVSWPLTLHLVARAHTSGSIDLKPENANQVEKAVLYRSIVADTALRQDEQAGGRGRLNPQQMRRFVQAIAWEMYSTGREALDVSEGLPILRGILPEATESDLAELADVTIVNQPELTRGEETGFEFVHKSFSEYFAAETIAIRVEEVCFKVAQWGGDEEAWRMSVSEATSTLARLFAVRLLTIEVQEMLSPMLDDFRLFLEGKSSLRVPEPEAISASLQNKLLRFEELMQEFSGGGLLREVASAARSSRLVTNELESFGNFASALLFVAVALVGRLNGKTENSDRMVRVAAPTLIRLIHIVLAGEIPIDWTFSERALVHIDARRGGRDKTELHFPPIPPTLLVGVRGLDSPLEDAVIALDNQLASVEVENILLTFVAGLAGSHVDPAGMRHMRYDYRYRQGSAPLDYLQRIVPLRGRDRYEESRYFERRIFDMIERLRGGPAGSLPAPFVEEAIMHIRELAHEGRYRGMNHVELYERAEAMLHRIVDPGARPTRRSRRRSPPTKD